MFIRGRLVAEQEFQDAQLADGNVARNQALIVVIAALATSVGMVALGQPLLAAGITGVTLLGIVKALLSGRNS